MNGKADLRRIACIQTRAWCIFEKLQDEKTKKAERSSETPWHKINAFFPKLVRFVPAFSSFVHIENVPGKMCALVYRKV